MTFVNTGIVLFAAVVICAFAPTHAVSRISNAVITFVNAFRVRSDETIVVLAIKADAIQSFSEAQAENRQETFDDNLVFVKGMPNTIRGLQSVDVCHARSICIIGCENSSNKAADTETVQDAHAEEVNTDLYIVLAALELDAVLSSYIRRLLREDRQAPLPVVTQEISTDATISFLPDFYTLSRKAKRLWEKHDKKIWESRRGMIVEEVDMNMRANKNDENEKYVKDSAEEEAKDEDVFISGAPALAQVGQTHQHMPQLFVKK